MKKNTKKELKEWIMALIIGIMTIIIVIGISFFSGAGYTLLIHLNGMSLVKALHIGPIFGLFVNSFLWLLLFMFSLIIIKEKAKKNE